MSFYLQTNEIPHPDFIIRTSGEMRLSNFMLWQAAYAELYFTDTLWPDFDCKKLQMALDDFAQRQRRYGSLMSNKTEQKKSDSQNLSQANI